MLRFPEPILSERLPPAHQRQSRQKALSCFLRHLEQGARWIWAAQEPLGLFCWEDVREQDRARVRQWVLQARGALERIGQAMEGTAS